jgi:WD40 repeat protein
VKRVASTQSGKYFATSSKDETIVVWQTETAAADPIVCILNEHEHVIDCIVWAPLDSARTIEYADYSGGIHSQSNVPREQENGSAIDHPSTLD